mgnify:CR=1 FL=1
MTAYAAHETEFDWGNRSDAWDRAVLDEAIAHLAAQGKPFSSNDLREIAPDVRRCLISRRFIHAQRIGLLRKVGYEPSTLPSTKGHPVAVYQPV